MIAGKLAPGSSRGSAFVANSWRREEGKRTMRKQEVSIGNFRLKR